MITEETIKQTRFFVGEDGKCYLVRDVRTVKLVTLICTRDGSESDLLLGDDVCKQFAPAEASFEPFIENQVAAAKPAAKTVRGPYNKRSVKAKAKKQSPKAGTKTGKRKKSKYKGVSPLKPYKSGKIRYQACYWDGKKKKCITIGTFDSEIEAAAFYQDYIGNKDEAARLRSLAKQQQAGLAEQAENNPDRPTHQSKKKKVVTVYVCKHCGLEYQSKGKCAGCGNYDMREVKKEVADGYIQTH